MSPESKKPLFNSSKNIHKMSQQQAVKEFKAAGFSFEKNISNLPWQHCLIFRKPKN